MCGIAGTVSWNAREVDRERLRQMTRSLTHRGPDDEGIWIDTSMGVALGQRRLSIIDLSEGGHQPMLSATGRYVLSFNGEIYNFAELRNRLEREAMAPPWRGQSDTEVLLACIEAWGVEAALKQTVGMFAVSAWDRKTSTLTLARDRLGEKPLYYGVVDGQVIFASELKAIKATSPAGLVVDRGALAEYVRFGYIPAPHTIYRGLRKMLPGHFLQIRSCSEAFNPPSPFWTPNDGSAVELRERLAAAGDEELIELLHKQLLESVRLQMVSDVPLGAFLSGGVDSSTVVALMQAASSMPVRTFTIGFDQREYDEAPFARAVASHLGTSHTELYVTARDAEQIIPRLPAIYDEPFADSSQIPTTLVSKLTRRHVTVSLSGDGGDELFAGYPRYPLTSRVWQRTSALPGLLRRPVARMLQLPSPGTWDTLLAGLPAGLKSRINGRRLHRLGQLMGSESLGDMYLRLMSQWMPEDNIVLHCGASDSADSLRHWDASRSPIEAMRLWDTRQYLPDDLLVKVDRAAMTCSLETRAPMLDHRVVELAFALPEHALVRNGVTKWALRQVLYRYVPRELIERPKAGFSVPLGSWLRGDLRDWAESLLDPERLRSDGFLNEPKITQTWKEHLSGRFDRSSYLWSILMFQAWLSAQRNEQATTGQELVAA